MQSLNEDATDAQEWSAPPTTRQERQHLAALEDLGLDGDEALQYALMVSREDGQGLDESTEFSDQDSDAAAAIRAVEQFQRKEEEEVARALEQVRLAEE